MYSVSIFTAVIGFPEIVGALLPVGVDGVAGVAGVACVPRADPSSANPEPDPF
jgi:hypothetical protein